STQEILKKQCFKFLFLWTAVLRWSISSEEWICISMPFQAKSGRFLALFREKRHAGCERPATAAGGHLPEIHSGIGCALRLSWSIEQTCAAASPCAAW
ncbi:hypothetical protein, partial [Desulfovibrio sp. SGI.169]|uniref:hypothetical protein n=1 Tax=Desulfovibrio sp. SGI.169 TaxID=3420561 RepID=UPI003D00B3B3